MKKINLYRIRGLVLGILVAAWLIVAGLVIIVSYVNYQSYYNNMLALKESLKGEDKNGETVMTGISIRIADGVGFYDNGKAVADKTKFVVEGLYTIDDREYVEELGAGDYTLEVPEDFTENGGTVTAIFTYTVEVPVEEGENPPAEGEEGTQTEGATREEQREFRASIDITLEEVKPVALSVRSNPYIVAYAEGDAFNKNGMRLDALYNDGTVDADVSLAQVGVETGALTVETEKVVLSYTLNGVTIYGEVPVTVMSKSEFTNGKLLEIVVPDGAAVAPGESLSSVRLNVMGKYSSGNYVALSEDQYTVKVSTTENVQFGGNYTVTVSAKENTGIRKRVAVSVGYTLQAESAQVSGATNYGAYVADFVSGSQLTFTFTAEKAVASKLYLKISNGYLKYDAESRTYYSEKISLSEMFTLTVNGKAKPIGSVMLPAGGPYADLNSAYSAYTLVPLGTFNLKAGENTLTLLAKGTTYTDYGGAMPFGRVDCLQIESAASIVFSSLGETVASGESVEYTATAEFTWGEWSFDETTWVYASCTDGTYLYFYTYKPGAAVGSASARIVKYDPEAKVTVGYTTKFDFAGEAYATLFYKEGYIYTINSQGVLMAVSSEFTGNGMAQLRSVPNVVFEGIDLKAVKGIYANASQNYAVWTGNTVSIHNYAGQIVSHFALYSYNGCPAKRITGNGDYIYILYSANGVNNPMIRIYTWSGEQVAELNIPNDVIVGSGNSNLQSLVELDGALYFTLLKWSGGNTSALGKISFGVVGAEETVTIDLGEYYETNKAEGYTADYKVTHLATVSGMYNHGLCTDGTYLYVADSPEIDKVRIRKVDVRTGNVVATTTSAVTKRDGLWVGGDYLFYKGGYVYNVDSTGKVWCIAAESIGVNDAALKEVTFAIDGFSGTIRSVSYNAERNVYAVMDTAGKVYVVDAATMTVKVTMEQGVGTKVVGIYCDANYVYALKEGAVNTPTICVYDYTGRYIGTCTDMTTGVAVAKNNVQSICSVGGTVYVLVCQWGGSTDEGGNAVAGGGYIYAVTPQFTNWQ